jgi:transposase-like protein
MTSRKDTAMEKEEKEPKEIVKKKGRPRGVNSPSQQVSAADKAQAVLAVWTERARPAEVCRQLGVNPITFSQWQDRAMEGMLQALESRVNLSAGQVLSPRLQALLTKRHHAAGVSKLEAKLARLSGAPKPEEAVA